MSFSLVSFRRLGVAKLLFAIPNGLINFSALDKP